MAKIPVLLTICCAVGLVGFGLVLWLQARRKGDRATGPAVLVGFPGLFLSLLASIGGPQWLYIPAGILVVSAYLVQFVMRPRRRVKSGADPRDDVNGRGVSGK